jgi:type IV pilus assembly protein PilC
LTGVFLTKFSYVIKDREGKEFRSIDDAASQAALVERLHKSGFFVVSIKELQINPTAKNVVSTANSGPRKFSHKGIRLGDLMNFSRQLVTMLEAGITLTRSLDVIISQAESQNFYKILVLIKRDVEQGQALSVAISKYPKVFNQFWVSLIEVGEASGTIPVVLNKLAFYLEQQASFRATVVSGVIYPAILFAVSMGAVAFFALVVGPKFESIFNSMKVELPGITKWLLAFFRFVKNNFVVILVSIVAFVILFKKYSQTYYGKLMLEGIMFKMPVLGEVYKLIIIERFSSQMAILVETGVPILYALEITERLVDNNTCALVVNDIKESVKKGELLVDPMKRSGFFPPMCIQMIMVGEETGELSKMLKHVAAFYQTTVETFMSRFSTIIEPFMIVFMGGVIGTIVVAMFMPMFNIAQLGGG